MRISNIQKEYKDGFAYLTVDVKAEYTQKNKLWFSVPQEFESFLTDDVYDAFLVAAIYPAMYYNEPIEIDGNVSPRLFFNVTHYIQNVVKSYRPEMHYVSVTAKGFGTPRKVEGGVGTGFSAGVDSFTTFVNHFVKEENPDFKISALFFFNVGSHGGGGEKARKKYIERYNLLKDFPKQVGLPYIPLDSNLFDFYLDYWEYDAGLFCRASAILVFQRKISKYYLSSDYSYKEIMYNAFNPYVSSLSGITETFMNPMLSTESLDIITDGAQYTRTEKTELIVDYPPVREFLNVCVDHWNNQETAKNCGVCGKCLRTLVALESLGKLELFRKVFDIELYKKKAYWYKCFLSVNRNKSIYNRDNYDFAKLHGIRMPSLIEAHVRLIPSHVKGLIRKILKKIGV